MALALECCWTCEVGRYLKLDKLTQGCVQSEREIENKRVWFPVLLMYVWREMMQAVLGAAGLVV